MAHTSGDSQQLDKNGLVKPILSHEIIQAYLKDELSESQRQEISHIKKEYSEYELFFYLLDELKSNMTLSEFSETESEEWLTHTELEKGLYQILTGEIKREDAQKLISALHQSQTLYRKTLTKVGEILPQMQDIPEMSEITIKSNEEVLAEIIGHERDTITDESAKESWLKQILSYRISVPSYAVLAPAFLLLIALITVEFDRLVDRQHAPGTQFVSEDKKVYVYDDNIPVPFSTSVSTFRDISGEADADNQYDKFLQQFQIAMRDYELLDYASAVERMERMRPLAQSVLNESKNENASRLIKDYYFYLGITHFALFRSQKIQSNDRIAHGNKAVEYLETSQEIAEKNNLALTDKDHFFLGLAYGFTRQVLAEMELNQIGQESTYFKESRELLGEF